MVLLEGTYWEKEEIILDFLSKPEIFADLFNGVIFQGNDVISADALEDIPAWSRLILKESDGDT